MSGNFCSHMTDEELKHAAAKLNDYTSIGQEKIISEMRKRGMEVPLLHSPPRTDPTNTLRKSTPEEDDTHSSFEETMGLDYGNKTLKRATGIKKSLNIVGFSMLGIILVIAAGGIVIGRGSEPMPGWYLIFLVIGFISFVFAGIISTRYPDEDQIIKNQEIADAFRQFAGDEKYNQFIAVLRTTCIERKELMYWQKELWRKFCGERSVEYTTDLYKLFKIFGIPECGKELRAAKEKVFKEKSTAFLKIASTVFLVIIFVVGFSIIMNKVSSYSSFSDFTTWRSLGESADEDAYLDYVSSFPDGAHFEDAIQKIISMRGCTVKISQSYNGAKQHAFLGYAIGKRYSLPLTEILSNLIFDSKMGDVDVRLEISGVPLGAHYKHGGYYYTGAKLYGFFIIGGHAEKIDIEFRFNEEFAPAKVINEMRRSDKGGAPFEEMFHSLIMPKIVIAINEYAESD